MKRIFFHGTNADALPDILKNGLLTKNGGENWNVSGSNVYFWSPNHLVKHGESEEDCAREDAFQRAFESAQISLGFTSECRAVVLEVELDDENIQEDGSCGDVMIMAGAVYTCDDVPVSAIKKVYVSNDLSLLKGMFLSVHLRSNFSGRYLSDLQKKIAKVFASSDLFDVLYDTVNWEVSIH